MISAFYLVFKILNCVKAGLDKSYSNLSDWSTVEILEFLFSKIIAI